MNGAEYSAPVDRVWTVVDGADIGVVDGAGSAEVETAPPWCPVGPFGLRGDVVVVGVVTG